jgi:hypothetical protein
MVIEVNKINAVNNSPSSSPSSSSINASDSASAIPPSVDALISEDAQQALKHWESNFNKQLTPMFRKIAIEAYNIHYRENRGITREDIVDRLGYPSSYAKKVMYECKNNKLLTHLEGYKQGRFKEYFLPTEIDRFIEKQSSNSKLEESLDHSQLSVIQILINEITGRKPTFHKLMIHVKMVSASSGFDQDYNLLTAKNGWIVKSQKNKAKVKSFKLEHKRSCTIQVYPNGKLIVILECSYRPFKLNETDGCREFFGSIGKIELIISQQFQQQYSIVPPHGEWLLKEYDRDITIPESELLELYPYIKQWYSKEGIKIKAVGHVFQIYGKIMPVCGKCLRLEENVSIKEDIPLEQGIKNAIKRPFAIVTAFELLKNKNDDTTTTANVA